MGKHNILFVCTANICRSPMAAAFFLDLCKKAGRTDVNVDSAGISAVSGTWASFEAIELMLRNGVNMTAHTSKSLDASLIEWADLIVCMAAQHQNAVVALSPKATSKTRLLLEFSDASGDLPDPFGGTYEYYVACLEKMQPALQGLLVHITGKPSPPID